jgi:hypothetical protein
MSRRTFVRCALVSACVSLSLGATGASAAQFPPDAKFAPVQEMSTPAAAAPTSAMRKAAIAELRAREAKRQTPEAKAKRRATRTKFRNLSGSDAASVARSTFGSDAVGATWSPPAVDVKRYLSQNVAQIDPEGPAKTAILDSSLPLIDDDGIPIDLSLAPAAGGFVAQNPLVDVTIPTQSTEGVDVGDADPLTFTPSGNASTAIQNGERVMYPNSALDTDWVVAPAPRGVQFEAVLRSADAPEHLSLDISSTSDSPAVTDDGKDGAAISRDGKLLASIAPPVAWDAQDQPVPVHYEYSAGHLGIAVDHREGDYAYPIMVDPVVDWQYDWNTSSTTGISWTPETPFPYFYTGTSSGSTRGLWLTLGNQNYGASYWSWWKYLVPGYTSEIDQLNIKVTHSPATNNPPVCVTVGFNTGATGGYAWPSYRQQHWTAGPLAEAATGPVARCLGFGESEIGVCQNASCTATNTGNLSDGIKIAAVQQWTYTTTYYPGVSADYSSGAAVILSDPEDPTITGPSGTANTPNDTWTLHPTDLGLGIKRVKVSSPTDSGWTGGQDTSWTCFGTNWSPCPVDGGTSTPTYGQLAYGPQTITVEAWDAGGRHRTQDYSVNVNYYWASWAYGGADHSINGPTEAANAAAALEARDNADDSAGYDRIWRGIAPGDRERVSEETGTDPPEDVLTQSEFDALQNKITGRPTNAELDADPTAGGATAATVSVHTRNCGAGGRITSHGAGHTKVHRRFAWKANKGTRTYQIHLGAYIFNCAGAHSRVWWDPWIDTRNDGPSVMWKMLLKKGDGSEISWDNGVGGGWSTFPGNTVSYGGTYELWDLPTTYFANGNVRATQVRIPNAASIPDGWVGSIANYKAKLEY